MMPGASSHSQSRIKLTAVSSKVQVLKNLKKSNTSKEKTDELEEWKRARALMKPPDQLSLPDEELKEEIARVLTLTNPQLPDNLVEFNYAQGTFLPQPIPGNTVVYINMKGTVIHRDSNEAQAQIAEFGADAQIDLISNPDDYPDSAAGSSISMRTDFKAEDEGIEEDVHEQAAPEEEEEEEAKAEEDVGDDDEDEDEGVVKKKPVKKQKAGGRAKKLTNQFNFSERAALTYNLPIRSQETQTVPPPRGTFNAQVLQWIIFDAYAEDFEAQMREKEKEKKVPIPIKKTAKKRKVAKINDEEQKRIFAAWKTLERMVNLNTYDDIAKDYRYYEDPSDEYRDEEGTLLPLWKFTYEETLKTTMITDIMFNPWYYDLFAVCFGSMNFMRQVSGALCLYTIKNPSFPEYICVTEHGVMCVDIHPKYPFMVAIGLYDGSVMVYNIHLSCAEPQFQSNSVLNKHFGIVWEIKWGKDLQDGEMNFYSVAGDGRVNNWVLMQNDLSLTTIIILELDQTNPVRGPDGSLLKPKGSASCMTFHPEDHLVFMVGTEEGFIYKCSTLYSSTYLFTYRAHHMPVYRIDFNHFNSNIFISCSADWRIKIWEDKREEPLFVFDLGTSVGDVKWAPYSSTVFAAVSSEGCVFVYDLNVNKYKVVCKQAIVPKSKSKLTRLCFNNDLPILVVGDDLGCVTTLKLSPNLRIPCRAPKKQQHLDQFTLQCMKLDKVLALVREPQKLEPPPDVESVIE